MKLQKIYISAFGKLKDYTLDLNDGFNVLYGENEAGKSTVMAFIKAMFYGTGKKTQNLSNSPRIKYAPFDGSFMAGRIYFESNGTEYCLERQFNKSDTTDKITLINLDTGETSPETGEVGTRFFGIGGEAFERSMFIGAERNYAVNDEASGELNQKLSNLVLTGDDNTSYQKIESRIISDKEKILSKSGRAGTLVKDMAELENLKSRLALSKDDAEKKIKLVENKKLLKEKATGYYKKYLAVKKLTDSKEDIKNREKLKEYVDLKSKLDDINSSLTMPNGKIMDSSFLSKIKFCYGKLKPQSELCESILDDIEKLKKEISLSESLSTEETEEKIRESKETLIKYAEEKNECEDKILLLNKELKQLTEECAEAENLKKPFNLPMLIIGAVLTVAAVIVGLAVNTAYLVSAAAGGIILALSFVLRPADTSKYTELTEEISSVKEDLNETVSRSSLLTGKSEAEKGKLALLENVLNTDRSVKEKKANEIKEKEEKLLKEKEKEAELGRELYNLLDGYDYNPEKSKDLEEKVEAQKDIKLRLSFLAKDLGNISYADAEEKLKSFGNDADYSNVDFDAAEKERDLLLSRLEEIKQGITAIDTELITAFRNSEQPETVQKEINILEEKITEEKDFVNSSEIALNVLAESFATVRRGYGKALEEKTLDNFSRLTHGQYGAVSVSKSMEILVEKAEIFGMKEAGYLSTGTQDQAFLSLRLAICDYLSEKESLPVFLDDALSNYDHNRTFTAMEFLKEFSKNNQVLLFTCHKSICETSGDLGVSPVNLI